MKALLPPELRGWRPKSRGWQSATTGWLYEEMSAAYFWRLTPWEFDGRSQDEKARMIAYRIVRGTVEAWEYEQMQRAAEQESSNSSGGGRGRSGGR